ncbi:arylsulfatase [Marinilongibacter aquaticus]|uniref:arylsulfatase n=1 Tax=Marinilongibacter aquaticus TaxID=2975157 RepID=UPI0021BDB36D|nr:arylsulfatase [Marinilongibacter aquaticus]UBM59144.1 arylsulfatase [Marinilongibacter aquaticus]
MHFRLLIFCTLGLLSCGTKNTQKDTLRSHPNIVYILADDLGYGDLGCYGQQTIKTPHIDALAQNGMLFTNHYAGSSVCAPSRASLMTGKHTGHAYVRGNYETGPRGFGAGLALRNSDITVAEMLKKAQYQTALIGKWGMGMDGTPGEPNKQGFDYSYGFLNQGHAHNQFPTYLFRNGEKIEIAENKNLEKGAFSNDLFTQEALSYLDHAGEKPFFLYMAYTTPHAEMVLPESPQYDAYKNEVEDKAFKGLGNTDDGDKWAYRSTENPAAAYAAQISHLDACVGKIVEQLKRKGLEENTIVIFSSDNGPHAEGGANPAYFNSAGGLKGMKRDLYEGGIKVPMILKWPAAVAKGSKTDLISSFWDFLPTVAEIAEQKVDELDTDGISFLPTLLGEKQEKHDYLYWEFHENTSTDQAIRRGKFKAIRHDPKGKTELYNLEKDREEEFNIASENPEIISEMDSLFKISRTPHTLWKLKSKQD